MYRYSSIKEIENIDDVYSLNESNCKGDGCWFFNDIALINESEGSGGLRPGIKSTSKAIALLALSRLGLTPGYVNTSYSASVCPAAMVFVPSVNGISHNVEEYLYDSAVENGANVLLNTVSTLVS